MGRYNKLNQYRHILSRFTTVRFAILVGFIVTLGSLPEAKPIRQRHKKLASPAAEIGQVPISTL
jgi:ABC-type hemin transport system ATPase subunit